MFGSYAIGQLYIGQTYTSGTTPLTLAVVTCNTLTLTVAVCTT